MSEEEMDAFFAWVDAERRALTSADCECRTCGEIDCECEA